MRKWLMRLSAVGLLAVSGVAGGLAAAPFVPPAEDVVVFRRDRLPLDVDSMAGLAQQLLTLAQAQGGRSAADRRGVAQMLALAVALQPGDADAAKFGKSFAGGEQQARGEPGMVAKARQGVWRLLGCLEAAEAGEDAHALAACLGDVMVLADPTHPQAGELSKKGERGAWDGWVKPPDAFAVSETVVKEDPKIPLQKEPPGNPPEPADGKPVKLAKASLKTVVWAAPDPYQPRKLIVMPLLMEAAIQEPQAGNGGDAKKPGESPKPGPFSCAWINPKAGEQLADDINRFKSLSAEIRGAVEAEAGPLPAGVNLNFRPDTLSIYRLDKDPVGISGPLAVLMHAAVSGAEPQGIVIGTIQKDGSFRLPVDFWERLRALSGQGGGRLVLPAEAEAFLPSILALEDAGFFLDYEVLYAANYTQLIERTARKPQGELANGAAQFAEIRGKRGTQPVSSYVANRFVRQRLEEIARTAPFHASARMLAVQGAGQRPTKLPTTILATELLAITGTTNWIVGMGSGLDKLDADALTTLGDSAKTGLKVLERYAELRDRGLLDQANDLMVGLRTFSRALRKRTDPNGKPVDYSGDFAAFRQLHERVTNGLKLGMRPDS